MRVVLFGVGATGARAARQLGTSDRVKQVEIRDPRADQRDRVVRSLGPVAVAGRGRRLDDTLDVAVVATPTGSQVALARRCVRAGVAVVTTSDDLGEVRRLLELDAEARAAGVPVVVGAGFMPGVSCLLARHAASELDAVDEIHVAKMGTGGPACARQHHRALSSTGLDWRDGEWVARRGGSGRELAWFPDPIDGHDCYRAALPDAVLLAPAFPGVERVTARMAATRRDRLTAPLPMLRRPHPEGRDGAVRVEVRGRVGTEQRIVVLGAAERPGVAAGAMAAVAAVHAAEGGVAAGAAGLAAVDDPLALLRALEARGVRPARFEGVATFS